MRTRYLLFVLLLLIGGCRPNSDGALFRDRFDDPRSGWGHDSTVALERGYQDGDYYIELFTPNWLSWATPGQRFDDVVVEAEARSVNGGGDGNLGLICRFTSPDNFYYFAVTGDGYYAIILVEDGEPEVLTGDGFLPSPAVHADNGVYDLRAVCQGDQLSLYVGDQEVATVSDDTWTQGDIGIGVGSGPSGTIRVNFDNVLVTAPQE